MLPTGGIFGHLGRFLGRVLFGSPTPGPRQQGGGHHHIPPPKKKSDPLEIHHTITPRGSSSRALVPVTTAAQKSYAAEYNRLYGILQAELAGLKTALAPRDRQRNRRRGTTRAGADIPPETTQQIPRPYNKRDTTQHGYLHLEHGYQDGQDVDVDSSWIGAFNFRVHGGDYGGNQDPRDKGDLTLVVLKPSAPNPSGRYTYPHVPRPVMDKAMLAPSKGRFYWATLRHYSNRGAIGRRMLVTAQRLINNPTSPHADSRRRRR